jgi:hypothetical protein
MREREADPRTSARIAQAASRLGAWLNAKPGQVERGAAIVLGSAFLAICLGCASFQFGGHTEVVPPAPAVAAPSDDPAITQSGTGTSRGGNEQDVFYPVPFASPPNLEVHDIIGHVVVTEQRPDRFHVKNVVHEFTWKARGVPVTATPAQPTPVSHVKFENAVPAAAPAFPPEPSAIDIR